MNLSTISCTHTDQISVYGGRTYRKLKFDLVVEDTTQNPLFAQRGMTLDNAENITSAFKNAFQDLIDDLQEKKIENNTMQSSVFLKLIASYFSDLATKAFEEEIDNVILKFIDFPDQYTSQKLVQQSFFTETRYVNLQNFQTKFDVMRRNSHHTYGETTKYIFIIGVDVCESEFYNKDFLLSKFSTHDIWLWKAGKNLLKNNIPKESIKTYLLELYKYYKDHESLSAKNKSLLTTICTLHLDELVEIANANL